MAGEFVNMQNRADSSTPHVKFILVSGGVISGIGKGLTASSLGVLLKCCGWRVTAIKIDPYLNIDAGTMSPFEHGEVFVLNDGGEVDLDLGNYERFLDVTLSRDNNITTGKIYSRVLEKEREGSFLGKTVQVVPHITDEIQDWIMRVARKPDRDGKLPEVCVIELGGTIGDIESMPFVEALRQLRYKVGDVNFCSVFVSLVPELGVVGEQKTKPTQHGVKSISSMGLSPHLIVCRSTKPLEPESKKKLAMFCQVAPDAVASVHDVPNTYQIPLILQQQGICNLLIRTLQLVWRLPTRLSKWAALSTKVDPSSPISNPPVTICIVGKYTGLSDAYISVVRAVQHAGIAVNRRVEITWVESSHLEPVVTDALGNQITIENNNGFAADVSEPSAPNTPAGTSNPSSKKSSRSSSRSGRSRKGNGAHQQEKVTRTSSQTQNTVNGKEEVDVQKPENDDEDMPVSTRKLKRQKTNGGESRSVSPDEMEQRYEAAWELLNQADGILVPGGFGDRGAEGKIQAIAHARKQKKPFLGICLGMQLCAVEAVRRVYNEPLANSAELDEKAPVKAVIYMPEVDRKKMGGTMRLGSRKTIIRAADSIALSLYGSKNVYERHRHRYEVNPEVVSKIEHEDGIKFVGKDETGTRMEILERKDHPFFFGTQFHPEFTSRPGRPSPPFVGLLMAAAKMPLDRESITEVMQQIHEQDPWGGDQGGTL